MLVSSVRSAGRASPLPAAALSVPLLPLLRCRGRGVVRCHGGGGATLDMAPNTRAHGGRPRAMTTRTVWRVCYGGVWAFGIASTLYAGERVHRTVVIDGRSFPAEIVILVDASGSMSERSRYPLAVTEALAVAEQASDAGRVKFGIFGAALTWEPRGWIKMPDADALKAARAWLAGWVPSGNTDIIGAVEEALRGIGRA